LQPKVAETYEPIQTKHAKNLILDILNDPKNHQGHATRYEYWLSLMVQAVIRAF
jgi:hypothetical protein